MIEIALSDVTGVVASAEADDPEAALVAARTLWEDMVGVPYAGKLTLVIRVNGALLYKSNTLVDVSRALAAVAS